MRRPPKDGAWAISAITADFEHRSWAQIGHRSRLDVQMPVTCAMIGAMLDRGLVPGMPATAWVARASRGLRGDGG